MKTFFIGTSKELKEEFSRKPRQEEKIIPEDSQGFFLYIGELCSGLLTIDGLFRMGYIITKGLSDRTLFEPYTKKCFDIPGIIGYIRERKQKNSKKRFSL